MNPLLQIASKFRQWAIPHKPPRLLLEEEQIHELMKSRTAAARFAKRLIEQLQTYPHFVILKRTSFVGDGAPIERLIKAIARTLPLKAGQTAEDRPQLEVSRIDVNIEKAAETHLTTRYSRTNQPLALHTDDSFRLEPRELVVFDFVQADRKAATLCLQQSRTWSQRSMTKQKTRLRNRCFRSAAVINQCFGKTVVC